MKPAIRHDPNSRRYLTRRQKAAIYGALGLLWLSGAVWLVLHFYFPQRGPFGDLPNPAEHWLMVVHGAAVFAALWAGGWLWRGHVTPWQRSGTRRRSGNGLLWTGAALIVTGYLLYYAPGDSLRSWISITHWSVGLASVVAILVHMARSGRYRSPP